MGYEFHKLYADLIAEDGTVCVLYQAWVRVLGRPRAYGALELYHPDGQREVLLACRPPRYLTRGELDRARTFSLELSCGRFTISFDDDTSGWQPSAAPCAGLDWAVTIPRARATAHWERSDRPDLAGTGYADRATLTRITRRMGFKALRWGRIHLPDRTLVFNAIDFRSGQRWARLARWSSGHPPVESDEVSLQLAGGAGTVGDVRLSPQRVLHSGSAFDPERIPGPVERALSRAVGGQTEETRWLTTAEGTPQQPDGAGGRGGSALHEWVRFGAHARATAASSDEQDAADSAC